MRLFLESLFLFGLSVFVAGCSVVEDSLKPLGAQVEGSQIDMVGETVVGRAVVDPYETEPPKNPYLAQSAWAMSHRTSYVQGSSPLPGPEAEGDLRDVQTTATDFINITLAYTEPYPDGRIAAWGSSAGKVYKVTTGSRKLKVIDSMSKDAGLAVAATPTSGAYVVLDNEGVFYAPAGKSIGAYTDADPNDSGSDIVKIGHFDLPIEDDIVGLNMTYDGKLALATKTGLVLVLERDFSHWASVALGEGNEEVSNSIAVDEQGGIYVATSVAMYRAQWDGTDLTVAWSASYEAGDPDDLAPGRLGPGTGSTPSLMGVAQDDDRFVVITDGQRLMHVVLFWRDDIPADWVGLPGRDRRIAAEVPVTFGDPSAETSVSEQSVLIRGYDVAVVSNLYGSGVELPNTGIDFIDNMIGNAITVFFSNFKSVAPYGVEKFSWNPATRTLAPAWSNPEISCPNGIPTMSAASNLMYCIGQRPKNGLFGFLEIDGIWNVEALDWSNGASVFYKKMGRSRLKYNSFYAGTEIGPDGGIISGTPGGVMQLRGR